MLKLYKIKKGKKKYTALNTFVIISFFFATNESRGNNPLHINYSFDNLSVMFVLDMNK